MVPQKVFVRELMMELVKEFCLEPVRDFEMVQL